MPGATVYIVRCRDGHYYVGSTRGSVERRVGEHNDGIVDGYTKPRRPVVLVYAQWFERMTDAFAAGGGGHERDALAGIGTALAGC